MSDATQMDCEDFLELVWGTREGWIDLPAKAGGYWVPFHTEWPDEGAITRRIDSSLRDREDLYYSVAQFKKRGRRIEDVLSSHWLWADLDEVHPTRGADLGLLPTVAVESSPGRYQALWRLTKRLGPKPLEKVNRALSYALDADKSGWDLTQVLRLPGTRNWKYPGGPVVEILWVNEELVYDPREVWGILKKAVPDAEMQAVTAATLPRLAVSSKAKRLLRTPVDKVVEGERSHQLWQLECLLAESGLVEEEIFDLVWPTAWNKWRGVHTGRERLHREIKKAIQHVKRKRALGTDDRHEVSNKRSSAAEQDLRDQRRGSEDADGADEERPEALDEGQEDEVGSLPFVAYSSFMAMSMEEPKWLIEDIWVADSHGIIGGEPKTQKTTLALAMAMAVASGQPMLGRWPVGKQGPVLFVQEENAPWMMQDRMRKIAAYTGLISTTEAHVRPAGPGGLGSTSVELDFPFDLPLRLLNNFGFDLALDEHREMLWAEVENIRPALVILDPLYLVLGGANENQSHELRPFLKWLLSLRYEFNCAVAVVHHMRKQQVNGPVVRPGQRLMGNATLHGWVDSGLYTTALDENRAGWVKTRLESEFRSQPPRAALEMALTMGQVGSLIMETEIDQYDLTRAIENIVREEPGVTIAALSRKLGADRRMLLARVRGSETMVATGGKKGRGQSWAVSMARANGSRADSPGEDPRSGVEDE